MSCWLTPDVISLVAALLALVISEALALSKNGKYNGILQVALDFVMGVMRSKPSSNVLGGALVAGAEAAAQRVDDE